MKELLETIKDTNRDYVGTNGCLYQDITREELDLIIDEIERLNNIINELEKWLLSEQKEYRNYLSTRPTNDSEYNSKFATQCGLAQVDVVLDKLKELKEKK